VGAADVEDGGEPFEEKMEGLAMYLLEQFGQSHELEKTIYANLESLEYEL
jgi:type I restriction enzyme M protein